MIKSQGFAHPLILVSILLGIVCAGVYFYALSKPVNTAVSPTPTPISWGTLTSSDDVFSINYPIEWEIKPQPTVSSADNTLRKQVAFTAGTQGQRAIESDTSISITITPETVTEYWPAEKTVEGIQK